MKFIDDAIKESEKRMENEDANRSSSDLDEELLALIDKSRAQITVIGTGGATVTPQVSMDGVAWIPLTALTLTGTTLDSKHLAFTTGWCFIRLNITALGSATQLVVVVGD